MLPSEAETHQCRTRASDAEPSAFTYHAGRPATVVIVQGIPCPENGAPGNGLVIWFTQRANDPDPRPVPSWQVGLGPGIGVAVAPGREMQTGDPRASSPTDRQPGTLGKPATDW